MKYVGPLQFSDLEYLFHKEMHSLANELKETYRMKKVPLEHLHNIGVRACLDLLGRNSQVQGHTSRCVPLCPAADSGRRDD